MDFPELTDEEVELSRLLVDPEDLELAVDIAAEGLVLTGEDPSEVGGGVPEIIGLSVEDSTEVLRLTQILELGRLDRSPKKNWVEKSGGLPKYIEKIAFSLHTKRGMTISRAIATAISRVKKWALGGDNVNADTVAKSVAAVAAWEALKLKNKARRATKKG